MVRQRCPKTSEKNNNNQYGFFSYVNQMGSYLFLTHRSSSTAIIIGAQLFKTNDVVS